VADIRYAAIMLAALGTGAVLLRRSQARLPITGYQKFGLALGAFCGGMIGSKIPFLLADIEGACNGSAWLANGKTIMAGLLGAYLGVELAKWAFNVTVLTGDTFAAPVAVTVAIGRVACFFGGCCFGQPTTLPWGCTFSTADDLPRHPTQLYEAAFHGACALGIVVLQRYGLFRYQLAKVYILCYLAYRFVTEFMRPEPVVAVGLTAYQWAAVALAPVFVALWIRDARRVRAMRLPAPEAPPTPTSSPV
jgi:phosphatidylglycerol:prolipoprotein diacylglycerol transferase